jgi:hypothetical protein
VAALFYIGEWELVLVERSLSPCSCSRVVFGPLSYVTGVRLGAAEFTYDFWLSVGVLAVVWGMVVPAMIWFPRK